MMTRNERQEYLIWLSHRVAVPEELDCRTLLEIMYVKEFVWVIGNDDNRIADARELKKLYLSNKFGSRKLAEPVNVLEVLIALSERMSFLIDIEPPVCAWMLIENLNLHTHRNNIHKINDILDALIWRTYKPNGDGGFFPLRHPKKDQRLVEIWYQMNEWIEENFNTPNI